ncbi:endonuclease domain-containing protein [Terrimonas sp. NA20]|uniref:Endonuclease domain-containing protein n=1 Tax=Terrimonas ginsenosidimutans TaxID=2908004 RepID=A0ABS9KSF6_9BACT|nr:DUF559 domain-containing protein [Terrimonas ginsenosidimutans]MCG2615260.1 endonuclease domain-containing protein [Terrimonas ginsenosidimutans]
MSDQQTNSGKTYSTYTGDFYWDIKGRPQTEVWGIIRQLYMEQLPKMIVAHERNSSSWSAHDLVDWRATFSPIEVIAWDLIKSRPNLVLYPQFPVFNYFIDFANPLLKVGLELDGKEFHDNATDRERDQMLAKYGWKIYRASGSLSMKDIELHEAFPHTGVRTEAERTVYLSEYQKWMSSSLNGLLEAISIYYFNKVHDESLDLIIFQTLQDSSHTGKQLISLTELTEPF